MKQLLAFTENEGDPVLMDVCAHYLVVASANGYVKLFDLSRRSV